MKYTVTKLDRRHTGYNVMKYYIEVDVRSGLAKDQRIELFKEYRAWLWSQFGPGAELDYVAIALTTTSSVTVHTDLSKAKFGIPTRERWAWRTDYDNQRLFLKSDDELAWFRLKWTGNENT